MIPLVLSLLMLSPAQGPIPLSGTAIDTQRQPLDGVEIYLSRGEAPDGTVPSLGRDTTGPEGRYRIAKPEPRRLRDFPTTNPFLFAYRAWRWPCP
ncbi:MAG: hypothetical protein IRY99_03120 [Isosphaeraceae bacterium]|nr:hypothetical protein [Isosphaeraceae bacterium]